MSTTPPDLSAEFRAAAIEYADRIKADRERRANPRKTQQEMGDMFAAALERQFAERHAENPISDLFTN